HADRQRPGTPAPARRGSVARTSSAVPIRMSPSSAPLQTPLQLVETARPEGLVLGEPVLGRPERRGGELDRDHASHRGAVDQPGAREDVEVLGDPRELERQLLDELTYRAARVLLQEREDRSAGGILQGAEGPRQGIVMILRHMAKYTARASL